MVGEEKSAALTDCERAIPYASVTQPRLDQTSASLPHAPWLRRRRWGRSAEYEGAGCTVSWQSVYPAPRTRTPRLTHHARTITAVPGDGDDGTPIRPHPMRRVWLWKRSNAMRWHVTKYLPHYYDALTRSPRAPSCEQRANIIR